MLIYWFYGRTHSRWSIRLRRCARTVSESFANLVTVLGALVTFNGFAIALLGFLHHLGSDQRGAGEVGRARLACSARIGLHVSAEIADRVRSGDPRHRHRACSCVGIVLRRRAPRRPSSPRALTRAWREWRRLTATRVREAPERAVRSPGGAAGVWSRS